MSVDVVRPSLPGSNEFGTGARVHAAGSTGALIFRVDVFLTNFAVLALSSIDCGNVSVRAYLSDESFSCWRERSTSTSDTLET